MREIRCTKNHLRAKTARRKLWSFYCGQWLISEVGGFRRPWHMGRRWAVSGIVHYFPGYKDVFALMDGWLYTCWVLSYTLYRSDFSSIFSHAMHRPRCSWCRSISEQQQPPAFVRGDPQWLGGVEALSAHKLPSAATVWWCRALKPSMKRFFVVCLRGGSF